MSSDVSHGLSYNTDFGATDARAGHDRQKPLIALYVLCAGVLMIVLDVTS